MPISSSAKRPRVVIGLKILFFLLLTGLMIFGLSRLVVKRGSAIAEYLGGGSASDVVFMGTSSVRRISPMLVDESSGLDSYILASNAQSLPFTELLLKECIARGVQPGIVVLNLQERGIDRDINTSDNTVFRVLTGARRLQKLKTIAEVLECKIDDYPEVLLPCVYNRRNLFGMIDELFSRNDGKKTESDGVDSSTSSDQPLQSGSDFNGVSTSDTEGTESGAADPDSVEARLERNARIVETYFGKGFTLNETVYMDPKNLDIGLKGVFTADDIKAQNLQCILDIIQICRDHDIDLIFCTIPALPAYLLTIGGDGHGGFHDYFAALAEQYGVPYWDLNYLRPEILKFDSTMFSTARHGNATYSLLVSPLIGQMLREYTEGTLDLSRYLFDDYETYSLLYPGIYRLNISGISLTESGEPYIFITFAADKDSVLEFQVTWLKKGGEEVLLSPWSKRRRIVLGTDFTPGKKYTFRVETRHEGCDEAEGSIVKTLDFPADAARTERS